MRTVDVELWYKKVKKPPLNLSRPVKFGIRHSDFETRIRESFGDTMKDFIKHSSTSGVKNTVNKKYSTSFRYCYLLTIILLVILGIIMIVLNWIMITRVNELVINKLHDKNLYDILFPAVGICSQNIISRRAVDKYSQYLYSLDQNDTFTLKDIKSNLMAFGMILIGKKVSYNPNFMEYLANVVHETNITNIMLKLAPKCKDLLEQCYWRSKRVGCKNLFSVRVTSIGFCCVFNSRYLNIDEKNVPYKIKLVGRNMGLSVAIRENIDDFLIFRGVSHEVEVMLFNGDDYPMVITGLRLYPAQYNATSFFQLQTKITYLAPELKHLKESVLGCRYAGSSTGIDTWSHCVARCQAKALIALCGCWHYTLPFVKSAVSCSLEHLRCLAKYREKFHLFYPGNSLHPALSEELANSLDCVTSDGCSFPCERYVYSADVSKLPHGDSLNISLFSEFEGLDLVNKTIIHLYYKNQEDISTSVLETYWYWFDVFSFIGSKWVYLTGVTVVSYVEMVYHCTIRWRYHYDHRKKLQKKLRRVMPQ